MPRTNEDTHRRQHARKRREQERATKEANRPSGEGTHR